MAVHRRGAAVPRAAEAAGRSTCAAARPPPLLRSRAPRPPSAGEEKPMSNRTLRSSIAPLLGACLVFAAPPPAPADETPEFNEMSLEQLLDVSIVSASNT